LIGHPNSPIRCIIDADSHLVSGTEDGDIIGWLKPNFNIDFRFKATAPLISMCKVKSHETELLLTAGWEITI